MKQMLVLIIDDPEYCEPVLEAWEKIGVPGVTIIESSGLGRLRQAGLRDDFPLMPSLANLFQHQEIRHRTLFSVLDDATMLDKLIAETQRIIGNLDEEHTGFMFVVPVTRAFGLRRSRYSRDQSEVDR